MIIVKLMGGLGNQMFQYAFGLMLADKLKQRILLDSSYFSYYNERSLNLKKLKPTLQLLNTDILFVILEKIFVWAAAHCRFIRCFNLAFHLKNIKEHIHAFEEKWIYKRIEEIDFDLNKLSNRKNYYLEGYWQNPIYFDDIRDLILNNVHFPELSDPEDINMQNIICNSESVAVHIRRGDYVGNKQYNEFFGTCSVEYYKNASTKILSEIPNTKFFLFTDDPDYVKVNFGFLQNTMLISNNRRSDVNELNLMHLCKHFIIANSTFSWWGAWLSQNPNKIVIAPKQWFKNEDANERCKIVPKTWIKL